MPIVGRHTFRRTAAGPWSEKMSNGGMIAFSQ